MSHESRELALFTINDGATYRRTLRPIVANLARKMVSGRYDPALAPRAWFHGAAAGAAAYRKEWPEVRFSRADITDAAAEIQAHYESEVADAAAEMRVSKESQS